MIYGSSAERGQQHSHSSTAWLSGNGTISIYSRAFRVYRMRLWTNNLWSLLLCSILTQLAFSWLCCRLGSSCSGENERPSTPGENAPCYETRNASASTHLHEQHDRPLSTD